MDDIKRLQQYINESQKIVFFGGAGVSTESGVPDFRSKDGLYSQHDIQFEQYSPEYLLSYECMVEQPDLFFAFYRRKMDARHVQPNITHRKLAELEAKGKLLAVVTQNIDGLHQKAGSKKVYELHGTTFRNYCARCGKKYAPDYIFESEDAVPRCTCGGMIRPDVALYNEILPEDARYGTVNVMEEADMLIIGGTSLQVYPAAGFIRYFSGKHIVVINREKLDVSLNPEKDLFICGSLGEVFEQIEVVAE